MVKVQVADKEYYLNGFLKDNLDLAKRQVKKNWDMPFAIDGTEGSGKSVLAGQIALYLDPSYSIERCAFTPEQFQDYCLKAEKYQAVVLDEGYGSLSSRGAMSKVNKAIVNMLSIIRRRNLFIIVLIPTFFDLDRYYALWRSRALFHVYHVAFQRGTFAFYGETRKIKLYAHGKKYYDYHSVKPDFRGDFTKHFIYDQDSYDKKKDAADAWTRAQEQDKTKECVLRLLKHPKCEKLNKAEVAKIFGLHRNTITNYTRDTPISTKHKAI